MSFDIVRQRIDGRLRAKAAAMLVSIEGGLDRIMMGWLLVAGLATAARIAFSPVKGTIGIEALLPSCSWSSRRSRRWCSRCAGSPTATASRSRAPGWRVSATGDHPCRRRRSGTTLYGTSGIMVSLLVGMLLNVPVRALEYLAAMPALVRASPAWLSTLHFVMTLDVVLLDQPLHDRLRRRASPRAAVPAAAGRDLDGRPRHAARDRAGRRRQRRAFRRRSAQALHTLLDGNVKKVLISVGLWLPYLLLSKRVNVTYRQPRRRPETRFGRVWLSHRENNVKLVAIPARQMRVRRATFCPELGQSMSTLDPSVNKELTQQNQRT